MKELVLLLLGLFLLSARAHSDDDGCLYEDIRGNWTFYIGTAGRDEQVNCNLGQSKEIVTYKLELKYLNKVVDMYGNEGTWTMVADQGFEVMIHGRKFFAYPRYSQDKYKCNETKSGWTHDDMGRDWSCYEGVKDGSKVDSAPRYSYSQNWSEEEENDSEMYKVDESLIERINSDNNLLWHAKKYERFEKMTVGQMKKRMGRKSSRRMVQPVEASQEIKDEADKLPENFDWRNVDGVNYISPVRDQETCGACYIFASAAMNEARLNIASGGTINVTLSPQDAVSCNFYSRGCEGGFEYLVGGKYSEDFGMVEESCNPYKNFDDDCNEKARKKCKKYYFTNYEYIGGYYGGCSEEAMRLALYKYGPIVTGILDPEDFVTYHGGIFHHTSNSSNFDPYAPVSHAVVFIGYGVDKATNTKYWIGKNSWDTDWGEQGFFRIRRGNNECNTESAAFHSFPIF